MPNARWIAVAQAMWMLAGAAIGWAFTAGETLAGTTGAVLAVLILLPLLICGSDARKDA